MSWLRNIQGQLTELANEVLSEATEEVADPESELQVSKKKCAEAEKELAIEKSRATSLESQVKELEQQVYGANVEMDAISSKYGMMVQARDEEIKKMKIQLEQLNEAGWGNTADEDDFDMKSQQISDLQREVAHWKSLAAGSDGNADTVPRSEMERRLEELRQKKENELTAILEQHAETMNELRESYEERIQSLQQYPASSSTSNTDMLDAVLLEKEELLEEKRKLEEMVKSKSSSHSSDSEKEKPVMVDLSEGADDVFERLRLAEHEVERLQTEKDDRLAQATSEADSLKEQNRELAQAYNDLNEEFENFKRESQAVESRNVDLSERIASLRANLIEYEERYEVCKRENLETVAKLERLSGDFERLRCGIADVQSRRQDTDATMGEEVDKLRNALEESRTERERLRADVQRFQEAVSDIDNELEHLRASNRRLVEENALMAGNMERLHVSGSFWELENFFQREKEEVESLED
ncbi:unnamed protein product [Caenorhabditis auriculariae]|uniref:Uncharacterized protein n=1 Tax=Caenorhabditis auriculariae TaxID=2777116 RepID=A0A8S1HTU9_9PELO|nr:unnamed protein product [Caenorhabditis auriculariae]